MSVRGTSMQSAMLSFRSTAVAPSMAAILLIAIVGFLPPEDERIEGSVAAELDWTGFVGRYRTETMHEKLQSAEGGCLARRFRLVQNISLQGRLDEANAMFENLRAIRNDLGLL